MQQTELRIQNGSFVSGSLPLVYAVGKKGLQTLPAELQAAFGKHHMAWIARETHGTGLFLEHTLETSAFSVGLMVALREHPTLELLSDADLVAAMPIRGGKDPKRPFALHGVVSEKGGKRLIPAVCDLAFGLREKETGLTRHVLVEIDRGHMPIARRGNLGHTSIKRKLLAYAAAIQAKQHMDRFGWKNLTVLILTPTQARVESCVSLSKELFKTDPKMGFHFLFGTLDASHDPLEHIFTDGLGNQVRLSD